MPVRFYVLKKSRGFVFFVVVWRDKRLGLVEIFHLYLNQLHLSEFNSSFKHVESPEPVDHIDLEWWLSTWQNNICASNLPDTSMVGQY